MNMRFPRDINREMMSFRATRYGFLFFLAVIVAGAVAVPGAIAEQYQNPKFGYYLDVPEGWKLIDNSNPAQISYSDPSGQAVFQVVRYDGDAYTSADQFATSIRDKLKATGDFSSYKYEGRAAMIADLTFDTNVATVRGYDVFIHGPDANYALLTYSPADAYDQFHDLFLSAIDSFAPGPESLLYPGPVSTFFRPMGDSSGENGLPSGSLGGMSAKPIDFRGKPITITIDPGAQDASQVLIEREARILDAYQSNGQPAGQWEPAWERYYRIIYRDNYHRLDAQSDAISKRLSASNVTTPSGIASEVLAFLQDFKYSRTSSLSDFQSPITSIATQSGDCDSLAMTYDIILAHLGIKSILMVSVKYSHAFAAVDVPGIGARFAFNGTNWLIAEMTAPVAIGMIPQQFSDPQYWIGIDLNGKYQ